MINIASIINIIDLGISLSLIHLISNYSTYKIDNNKNITYSIIKFSIIWTLFFAAISIVLIPVGNYIFKFGNIFNIFFNPWSLLIIISALNLPVNILILTHEGQNKLIEVYLSRLIISIVGFLVSFVLVYLKFKFWVILVFPITTLIINLFYIVYTIKYDDFFYIINAKKIKFEFWFNNILAVQIRFFIGWFSGYLYIFSCIPICYLFLGAEITGKLSVNIVLINTISIISLSIINSNIPSINKKLSLANRNTARKLLTPLCYSSMRLFALGSIVLLLFLFIIQYTNLLSITLSPLHSILLIIANAFYHYSSILIIFIYIKTNKIMIILCSFIFSFLNLFLMYFLTKSYDLNGLIAAIIIINIMINFPFVFYNYKKYFYN
jgi:hypothetical protein